jgi:hypothetical protein
MAQMAGGGISRSSGDSEEAADPQAACVASSQPLPPSTLKELQQQLPSCSERAAVYVTPGMSTSPY